MKQYFKPAKSHGKRLVVATVMAGGLLLAACDGDSNNKPTGGDRFISIGTGGVTGVYYPTGGAICRLVNKDRKTHGIRCSAESTDGSVFNLKAIRSDQLDMAVVQSDWQYHSYGGTSTFEGSGPFKELRAIFSIHPEPFTVVARLGSGIKTIDDLVGKRVNIGNPGSGQRGTMEAFMAAKGWDRSTFGVVAEMKASNMVAALCKKQLDAVVYTVGHPSVSIKDATTSCGGRLISVADEAAQKLIRENSYYREAVIPGGMYSNNDEDVKTFGVAATFVTSANMSADVVYRVVKAVFDNFDEFKSLHPAFANMKKEDMIKQGLSAPLHEGAIRYYREVGLM